MPTKSLWIVSKSSWNATIESIVPAGDTSWISIGKQSGVSNYPDGEYVDVILTENPSSERKKAIITITSNGKSIIVNVEGYPVDYTTVFSDFVCIQVTDDDGTGNNGMAVFTLLTVTKSMGGDIVDGYPKVYSILDAFENNPAISADTWASVSDNYREERFANFKIYVEEIENITIDGIAFKEDEVLCPIRTTIIDDEDIFVVDDNDHFLLLE